MPSRLILPILLLLLIGSSCSRHADLSILEKLEQVCEEDSFSSTQADSLMNEWREKKTDDGKARFLYLEGLSELRKGNIPNAAIALMEAEDLADRNVDAGLLGKIYRSLAQIYASVQDHEMALRYRLLQEEAVKRTGDRKSQILAQGMLAVAYNNVGEHEKADSVNNLFHAGMVLLWNDPGIAQAYVNEAYSEALRGEWDEVVHSLETAVKFDSTVLTDHVKLLMQTAILKAGAQSLSIANIDIGEGLTLPAEFWEQEGDFEKAYYSLRSYTDQVDSLYQSSIRNGLSVRIAEINEAKAEIAKLRIKEQRSVIAILLLAVMLLSFASISIWYIQRRKRDMIRGVISVLDETGLTFRQLMIKQSSGRYRELKRLYDILLLDSSPAVVKSDLAKKIYVALKDLRGSKNLEKLGRELDGFSGNAYSDLLREMPDIKAEDAAIFIYTGLGFPVGIISALMKTAEANVRNRRSRLRQKVIALKSPREADFLLILSEKPSPQ